MSNNEKKVWAECCKDGEHYGLVRVIIPKEYLTEEEAEKLFEELDEALCQAESIRVGLSDNLSKAKVRSKDKIDHLKQQSNDAMRSGRLSEAVRLYNQAWEIERGISRAKKGDEK